MNIHAGDDSDGACIIGQPGPHSESISGTQSKIWLCGVDTKFN